MTKIDLGGDEPYELVDLEAEAREEAEANWLWLPGDDAHIETPGKLAKEKSRATNMARGVNGKSRVWGCDGDYVWFRRKLANPATLERHEGFLARGEYKHAFTTDDVEVYVLQQTSPFRRKEPQNLVEYDWYNLCRAAARAAVKRDWVTYVDALEEMAGRVKGQYDSGNQHLVWTETLDQLEQMILRRQGPSRQECDREVINVRKKQGHGRGRQILLPS